MNAAQTFSLSLKVLKDAKIPGLVCGDPWESTVAEGLRAQVWNKIGQS